MKYTLLKEIRLKLFSIQTSVFVDEDNTIFKPKNRTKNKKIEKSFARERKMEVDISRWIIESSCIFLLEILMFTLNFLAGFGRRFNDLLRLPDTRIYSLMGIAGYCTFNRDAGQKNKSVFQQLCRFFFKLDGL